MTFDEADQIIATHLDTNWVTTPIAWPNVEPRDFQTVGQPLLPLGETDYIAIRTTGLGSRTVTVPGTCIRYSGQLFVASCVKAGTGVRLAKERLGELSSLLENATLRGTPGVVRLGTLTGPVAYTTSNGWYVEEIGIMYHFERFAALS